jgi:hypothetical protein
MRADLKRRLVALESRRPTKPLAELVPTDPLEFFEAATGYEPIDWQRRFLTSVSRRVLLNLSRQHGKSLTTGVYAVHRAILKPDSLILIGSPGSRQSTELLNKARRIYQNVGSPLGYEGDSMTRLELSNRSRIVALPASPDQIRGYSGPAAILLDEASRVADEVLDAVTPMMASNPLCRLVGMSTPAGARGWWWQAWESGGDLWERYEATADACPWVTPEFLAEERERMTEAVWLEEYFCKPFAGSAAVFSRDTIRAAIRPEFNTWNI